MTLSKLWARSGTDLIPRSANAFFRIGQATNSVVPGATVAPSAPDRRVEPSADGAHGYFEGSHIRFAGAHIAEADLAVIALDVYHYAIRQLEEFAGVRGDKSLFLQYAALYYLVDFGIFRFDGRLSPVEKRDFPEASGAGSLAADDEFTRMPPLAFG